MINHPLFNRWYRSLYRYGMHYVRRAGGVFSFDWVRMPSIRGWVVGMYRLMARFLRWVGELTSTLPPIAIPLFLVTVFLSTFVCIKLSFPFWSSQPVFHTYDWWRYLCRSSYQIQSVPPPNHKYYDSRVETKEYFDLSRRDLKRLCEFMQCNWIPSDRFFFTMTRRSLTADFAGHSEMPYVSIYWEPGVYTTPTPVVAHAGAEGTPLPDPLAKPPPSKQIAGCIFSRPLRMTFAESSTSISLYYMDYFCMNREKPDANVGKALFQTHEYHQRVRNPNISVSLFKKETDLCKGVVPLVQYTTYLYPIPKRRVEKLPAGMSCIQIVHDTNMDVLVDFMQTVCESTLFRCICMSDISHYVGLVKAREWFVFTLRASDDIFAMYFFKNAHIRYEETDKRTIQLVASICNTKNTDLFYLGFLQALKTLIRDNAGTFALLKIEDIGHNTVIVPKWKTECAVSPMIESSSAYYLYNYIVPKSPLLRESGLFL